MNQETIITIEELHNASQEVATALSSLSLQLNINPQSLTEQELQEMVNSGNFFCDSAYGPLLIHTVLIIGYILLIASSTVSLSSTT